MRAHATDTAATYAAALALAYDGPIPRECLDELEQMRANEAAIRRTVDLARRNRAAERSNPTAARAA
jgi:hypothetical protein